MPMTNATTDENTMTKTTLNKWWSKTTVEETDVDMEDNQEKEQEETTTGKVKMAKTIKWFPSSLRFKIVSDSKEEAHKKHQEILRIIAINVNFCEIYSTNGDKTTLKTQNNDDFDYHETRNKRQTTFTVIHRVVLDVKYHALKQQQAINVSYRCTNGIAKNGISSASDSLVEAAQNTRPRIRSNIS